MNKTGDDPYQSFHKCSVQTPYCFHTKEKKLSSDSVASDKMKNKGVVIEVPSLRQGESGLVNDPEISNFYGNSVTESYRLKSELISSHLTHIGMGR